MLVFSAGVAAVLLHVAFQLFQWYSATYFGGIRIRAVERIVDAITHPNRA